MPILTADLANEALDTVIPALKEEILGLTEREYQCEGLNMAIAVLPPLQPSTKQGWDLETVSLPPCEFLASREFGDKAQWPRPFDEIAKSKTLISWRTGLPSSRLQTVPQYLCDGDTLFWGSAIVNGIAVGVSGFEPEIDEMIAYCVGAWLQALCKLKAEKMRRRGEIFV